MQQIYIIGPSSSRSKSLPFTRESKSLRTYSSPRISQKTKENYQQPILSSKIIKYNTPKIYSHKRSSKFIAAYSSPSITETEIKENFRSYAEEINLVQQIKANGNEAWKAKEMLVKRCQNLVSYVANKYLVSDLEFKDLEQEGYIGLMKAIEKFEPGRGLAFASYATWWIQAVIIDAVIKAPMIRPSKREAFLINDLKKLVANHKSRTGEFLTAEQLSEMLELPLERIKELISGNKITVFLDDKVFKNKAKSPSWHEHLPDREDSNSENTTIAQIMARRFLDTLPPDQKRMLILEYYKDLNYQEAGEETGITRQRVHIISKEALNNLRGEKSNPRELSPYRKWSNDQKALNLMLQALTPEEQTLFKFTYEKWVAKSWIAKRFKVSEGKAIHMRNKLDKKLDKMYEIIKEFDIKNIKTLKFPSENVDIYRRIAKRSIRNARRRKSKIK